MDIKGEYLTSMLAKVDGHLETAERNLSRVHNGDVNNVVLLNAVLAGVMALVEMARALDEIKEELSLIELKMK
jgi:hypothetical protein